MAGKLHTDFLADDSGLHPQIPPGRLTRAYAEGYEVGRAGGTEEDNPHTADPAIDSASNCWWRGWRDASAGFPASHVGGPDAVAPPPPEIPETRKARK